MEPVLSLSVLETKTATRAAAHGEISFISMDAIFILYVANYGDIVANKNQIRPKVVVVVV